MPTKEFFSSRLDGLVSDVGRSVAVVVTTLTGETYLVKNVIRATEEYVILLVHPEIGGSAAGTAPGDPGEVPAPDREYEGDRLTLPYSNVASVRITAGDGSEQGGEEGTGSGLRYEGSPGETT